MVKTLSLYLTLGLKQYRVVTRDRQTDGQTDVQTEYDSYTCCRA